MIAYFSIKTLRKWFVLSANRWLSYGVFKSSLNYPGNGELLKHFHSYGIHNFSFPTHIFSLLLLWKGKKLWKSVKPVDINNKSTTKVKQNKSLFTFCTFFFVILNKRIPSMLPVNAIHAKWVWLDFCLQGMNFVIKTYITLFMFVWMEIVVPVRILITTPRVNWVFQAKKNRLYVDYYKGPEVPIKVRYLENLRMIVIVFWHKLTRIIFGCMFIKRNENIKKGYMRWCKLCGKYLCVTFCFSSLKEVLLEAIE